MVGDVLLKCLWNAMGVREIRKVEEVGALRRDFERETGMPRIKDMVGFLHVRFS